jgi:hypothetical protein
VLHSTRVRLAASEPRPARCEVDSACSYPFTPQGLSAMSTSPSSSAGAGPSQAKVNKKRPIKEITRSRKRQEATRERRRKEEAAMSESLKAKYEAARASARRALGLPPAGEEPT